MSLSDANKITFALPNKGRLSEPAVQLLKDAGYIFYPKTKTLYATCLNAGIVFVFVRVGDIPTLVAQGAIDVGITGQDLVSEKNVKVAELLKLGLGRCQLCVAVEENFTGDLKTLKGAGVATSFPRLTQEFFAQKEVPIRCVEMNGSVEIMVGLKIASAIVDLVESGDSLKQNHLKVLQTIGEFEAVLIANPKVKNDAPILTIKRRIEGILVAQNYSLLEYNIKKASLTAAEKVCPGFESPTVAELEDRDWVAVKVMVEKKNVVAVMDELERLGATAILETTIRNCRL